MDASFKAASFKVACVQLSASQDMAANIETACGLAREATLLGAELILFPENVVMMSRGAQATRANARSEAEHPALRVFQDLARELDIWLFGGTFAIKAETGAIKTETGKIANRAYVFTPEGTVAAKYDKIHMFDADLGNGESYRESETFSPGNEKVLVATPWGAVGVSTCYDVRFPYLYRALALAGAGYFAVPAAFAAPTGRAHWEVLLRARAIENGCYVFAPAQCGTHSCGRETYGHALIIDPWGRILADAGEEPGIIIADVDPAQIAAARARVPSLAHTRQIS